MSTGVVALLDGVDGKEDSTDWSEVEDMVDSNDVSTFSVVSPAVRGWAGVSFGNEVLELVSNPEVWPGQ